MRAAIVAFVLFVGIGVSADETSMEALYEQRKAGPEAFADASREIIRRAEAMLLDGRRDEARRHAMNVWLSSSPHESRQAAWQLLALTEPPPRQLAVGHELLIRSSGGRDHDRFLRWLHGEILDGRPWLRDVAVHYEPTLLGPEHADETAWIRFVLDTEASEPRLFELLERPGLTFPTDEWIVVRERDG